MITTKSTQIFEKFPSEIEIKLNKFNNLLTPNLKQNLNYYGSQD